MCTRLCLAVASSVSMLTRQSCSQTAVSAARPPLLLARQPHALRHVRCAASYGGGEAGTEQPGLLQRLAPIAAGAALFLGGYGTGLASSNLYADVQLAEQHRVAEAQVAPPAVKTLPVSLTMPDQVASDQLATAQQEGLDPDELSTIRVFQANVPSVVNVLQYQTLQSRYSTDVQTVQTGAGSGFFWDKQGHVVTNWHVIKGTSALRVTLWDQTSYPATVVGAEPDKDLAVLKLDMPPERAAQMQPVSLGSSSQLLVGQKVYALGNPFGLDHSLTQGIISGLGRELGPASGSLVPIKDVIQTDAAINPGNSGGALLDSKGNLIGINTAILDPAGKGANAGIGFAIPVDTAKGLVEQILQYGRVMRPSLGVVLAPPQALQRTGFKGVLVLDVTPGSPAEQAGLRPTRRTAAGELVLGDIIQGLDGSPVGSPKDLLEQLDTKHVGDKVVVDVVRGGQRVQVTVQLAERRLGMSAE